MQKFLAVVSRAVNYRDHDRVLTLITRERGAVTATARGCRKPQSKLLSAVQPFTYGEYVLNESHNRFYINQCDIKETFYNLRLDPDALQYAAYITALAEEFSYPEEENKELFSLLLNCLKYLCDEKLSHRGICVFFICKLMLFSGYKPCMNECVICGKAERLNSFSSEEGGMVCDDCRHNLTGITSIRRDTADIIDKLAMIPNSSYQLAGGLLAGREKEVFGIMSRYIKDRTGRKLPALDERYI